MCSKSRPCRVCRCWFCPGIKVGARQHVCGKPECQKEWHRRACAKVNKKNAPALKRARLETRLVKGDPPASIDWCCASAEVGPEIAILVEEWGKVVLRRAQESTSLQINENKRVRPKVIPCDA